MCIVSLFDCCDSVGDDESKVMMVYAVSDCSAILHSWQVDGVVIWVFRVLLSSNSGNIMKNNTCHYNITGPLRGHLKVTKALEMGFQQAYGHLHPGSHPAVSPVEIMLGAWFRVRVRGQQPRLTRETPVTQQKATKLSCNV